MVALESVVARGRITALNKEIADLTSRVSQLERAEQRRLTLNQLIQQADETWHGVKAGQPDWSHSSRTLAFEAELRKDELRVYLILNAYWEPLEFELPLPPEGRAWRRWIDTSLKSPDDIVEWQAVPAVTGHAYRAASRSVVVLFDELAGRRAGVG